MSAITFATCVRDWGEYRACRASIEALAPSGFEVAADAVDNAANRLSSARALNDAWERAADGLVVFCHEDVIFPRDWLVALRGALEALDRLPGPWGLAGPMGRAGKRFFGHALDENGAAASFVLLLLWAYYSAAIFLFGAEFTQVWARHHGRRIVPEQGAVRVVQETRRIAPDEPESATAPVRTKQDLRAGRRTG